MHERNRYADWFRRFVWLGIIANLFFAIPALFLPRTLNNWLEFDPASDTVWLQNVGLLLVLLNLFYMPVATQPFRYAVFARLTVAARFIASGFFLWIIFFTEISGVVWPLLATDFAIGCLIAFSLFRAFRVEDSNAFVMRRSLFSRFFGGFWRLVNERLGILWHWLPKYLGSFNLWGVRTDLREHNLHDTSNLASVNKCPVQHFPDHLIHRTPDGSYNDLDHPCMGRAKERFGRNAPHGMTWPDHEKLLTPNPREISLRLMTREEFIPATTLNLLAAAWIQFMNHGWFNHEQDKENYIEIPLREDDAWRDANGDQKMLVKKSLADSTRPEGATSLPTFQNTETHWWDGSQLYGSSLERQLLLREGVDGRMKILENGLLPLDDEIEHNIDLTGFSENWWMGLSLLHSLFVLEHNHICGELKQRHPTWGDDRLFNVARLINAGLMAKIHTVEWTPAILGHPTLRVSMDANWWGLLGENFRKRVGRVSGSEAISGIMGSPTDHHSAPFALTEEFVAVYRLHPLIPDVVPFYSAVDHSELTRASMLDIEGKHSRDTLERMMAENDNKLTNVFYSFGINHPGAITLHNYPRTLQDFTRADGEKLDLAAIDILRDRERGVPRYNDFREMLRMKRITSFEELTDNKQWAQEIKSVYRGNIDDVDLLVGMLAEPLPKGFGFSDTAFRIFILMASRRLKSDRFFTTHWNAETYTEFGLDWINNNDMVSVLLRHQPELQDALDGLPSAFAPWNRASHA